MTHDDALLETEKKNTLAFLNNIKKKSIFVAGEATTGFLVECEAAGMRIKP